MCVREREGERKRVFASTRVSITKSPNIHYKSKSSMSPTMKDARGMPGTLKKTIETGAHRSLGSIGRFLSEGDVVNITVGFILAETAYVVFTSLVVDILTPLGAAITPDTQLVSSIRRFPHLLMLIHTGA